MRKVFSGCVHSDFTAYRLTTWAVGMVPATVSS